MVHLLFSNFGDVPGVAIENKSPQPFRTVKP